MASPPGDSCAFPQRDDSISPRTPGSLHALVRGAVWLMLVPVVGALVTDALPWVQGALAYMTACSLALAVGGRLVPEARRRQGSGLNARQFTLFWNGQTIAFLMCTGMTAVAWLTWPSLVARLTLVLLCTATLLAQLTPFCAGRLVYLVLFDRSKPA